MALVYDRANTAFGGAERLLVALAQYFAPIDLFTPVLDQATSWTQRFHHLETSFISHLPLAQKYHQLYAPLMPLAIESFELSSYEVIISISSAESKAVLTKPHQLHLNYLLTPPRYLYQYDQAYLGRQPHLADYVTKILSAPARSYLRWFDQMSVFRPDIIVPISQVVRRRAQQIYPTAKLQPPLYPFATDLRPLLSQAKKHYPSLTKLLHFWQFNLSVARLVKYKAVDLAIQASLRVNQPLLIVGRGVEFSALRKLAGHYGTSFPMNHISQNDRNFSLKSKADSLKLVRWLTSKRREGKLIFFLHNVNDQILSLLYNQAQVVLAPGLEDFGLVPLEAAYFGTPSIIYRESGVAEVLLDRRQAWHLKHQSAAQLALALQQKGYQDLKRQPIKLVAQKFKQKLYLKKFYALVYDEWRRVSYKV